MERITYNKLVRDRIPEKIARNGEAFSVRQAESQEFLELVRQKVQEEATELSAAEKRDDILKEYADLMVVLDTLTAALEISPAEIELALKENVEKKGMFKERYVLEWADAPKSRDA